MEPALSVLRCQENGDLRRPFVQLLSWNVATLPTILQLPDSRKPLLYLSPNQTTDFYNIADDSRGSIFTTIVCTASSPKSVVISSAKLHKRQPLPMPSRRLCNVVLYSWSGHLPPVPTDTTTHGCFTAVLRCHSSSFCRPHPSFQRHHSIIDVLHTIKWHLM